MEFLTFTDGTDEPDYGFARDPESEAYSSEDLETLNSEAKLQDTLIIGCDDNALPAGYTGECAAGIYSAAQCDPNYSGYVNSCCECGGGTEVTEDGLTSCENNALPTGYTGDCAAGINSVAQCDSNHPGYVNSCCECGGGTEVTEDGLINCENDALPTGYTGDCSYGTYPVAQCDSSHPEYVNSCCECDGGTEVTEQIITCENNALPTGYTGDCAAGIYSVAQCDSNHPGYVNSCCECGGGTDVTMDEDEINLTAGAPFLPEQARLLFSRSQVRKGSYLIDFKIELVNTPEWGSKTLTTLTSCIKTDPDSDSYEEDCVWSSTWASWSADNYGSQYNKIYRHYICSTDSFHPVIDLCALSGGVGIRCGTRKDNQEQLSVLVDLSSELSDYNDPPATQIEILPGKTIATASDGTKSEMPYGSYWQLTPSMAPAVWTARFCHNRTWLGDEQTCGWSNYHRIILIDACIGDMEYVKWNTTDTNEDSFIMSQAEVDQIDTTVAMCSKLIFAPQDEALLNIINLYRDQELCDEGNLPGFARFEATLLSLQPFECDQAQCQTIDFTDRINLPQDVTNIMGESDSRPWIWETEGAVRNQPYLHSTVDLGFGPKDVQGVYTIGIEFFSHSKTIHSNSLFLGYHMPNQSDMLKIVINYGDTIITPFSAPDETRYCSSADSWTPTIDMCPQFIERDSSIRCPSTSNQESICVSLKTTATGQTSTTTETMLYRFSVDGTELWSSNSWQNTGAIACDVRECQFLQVFTEYTTVSAKFMVAPTNDCTTNLLESLEYDLLFNVNMDCQDYDVEQSPSSIPSTDPIQVVDNDDSERQGTAQGTEVQDNWSVSSRFYKLSRVKVWKSDTRVSGYEFVYEAPSDFAGYSPESHLFGNNTFTSEFETIFIRGEVQNITVFQGQDDNGQYQDTYRLELNIKKDDGGEELIGLGMEDKDSRTYTYDSYFLDYRLIGFKAITDSETGTILDMIPIQDQSNCEYALVSPPLQIHLEQIAGMDPLTYLLPFSFITEGFVEDTYCAYTPTLSQSSSILTVEPTDEDNTSWKLILESPIETERGTQSFTLQIIDETQTITFDIPVTVEIKCNPAGDPSCSSFQELGLPFEHTFCEGPLTPELNFKNVLEAHGFTYPPPDSTAVICINLDQRVKDPWSSVSWQSLRKLDHTGAWEYGSNSGWFSYSNVNSDGLNLWEPPAGTNDLYFWITMAYTTPNECSVSALESIEPQYAYLITEDCKAYEDDSNTQEATVPVYEETISTEAFGDLTEETWYVPHKFYHMTEIRTFMNEDRMSGLEVKFEAAVADFEPISHLFGTRKYTSHLTRNSTVYSLFNVRKGFIKMICFDMCENGLCGVYVRERDEECFEDKRRTQRIPNYSLQDSEILKNELSARFVGFTVKTGIDASGQFINIREIGVIVDDTSCEVFTYFIPSTSLVGSFDGAVYHWKTDSPTVSFTTNVSTFWGENCGHTIEPDPTTNDEDFPSDITVTGSWEISSDLRILDNSQSTQWTLNLSFANPSQREAHLGQIYPYTFRMTPTSFSVEEEEEEGEEDDSGFATFTVQIMVLCDENSEAYPLIQPEQYDQKCPNYCVDMDNGALDSQGQGCSLYIQKFNTGNGLSCGNNDVEEEFVSNTMCCVCKGGRNNFDWCGSNYSTDGDFYGAAGIDDDDSGGNECPDFEICIPVGEGTGELDENGHECPVIVEQCSKGWPFDELNQPCPWFKFCDLNFQRDHFNSLSSCGSFNDELPEGLSELSWSSPSRTRFRSSCEGQEIQPLDVGDHAFMGTYDSIRSNLHSSNQWIRVTTSKVGGPTDLKLFSPDIGFQGDQVLIYPDISTRHDDFENEYFKLSESMSMTLTAGPETFGEWTITFQLCSNDEWASTNCDLGESFTYVFGDMCDEESAGLEWTGDQLYFVDIATIIGGRTFELPLCPNLKNNLEYFQQATDGQIASFSQQYESSACDYSRGIKTFTFDKVTFTSMEGETFTWKEGTDDVVTYSQAGQYGFSFEQYTDIGETMFEQAEPSNEERTTLLFNVAITDVVSGYVSEVYPLGIYHVEVEYTQSDTSDPQSSFLTVLGKVELEFYLCQNCTQEAYDEIFMPEVVNQTEEVAPPDMTDPDVLFEQAKILFSQQYPMLFQLISGQSETIKIGIATDPVYESLSLIDDFGVAGDFTSFNPESGEITIEPDASIVGSFDLRLTILSDSREYERTMTLTIEQPQDTSTSEDAEVVFSDDSANGEGLFLLLEPITIKIKDVYTFVVVDHITAGLGTYFDKIELLEITDFSELDQESGTLVIMPVLDSQVGDYPFFVRVYDSQNRPYSQQWTVQVVMVEEEDVEEESQEVQAELVLPESFEVEQFAPQVQDVEVCDEQCLADIAQQQAEFEYNEAQSRMEELSEASFEVDGISIQISIDQLSIDGSGLADVFESSEIENLPVEVQEQLFVNILAANTAYKEQQRVTRQLEARVNGWIPPTPTPPALAFETIEPSGKFGLYFNGGLAGLSFLESLNKGLSSNGTVSSSEFRQLGASSASFDLSNYLDFTIMPGSEDSASPENLAFQVMTVGLENNLLQFQLAFENPHAVSIGSSQDSLKITVVDGTFFSSSDNGLPVESGTTIEQILPKMLEINMVSAMETTKKSVETFLIGQIIVTVILAISLKSMWNLMNVIQVISYVRFFSGWPAVMMETFRFLDDAITLKPVTDPIFEYGQSKFAKANSTLTDESMRNAGVQDTQLFKSLGLFTVIVVLLGILVVFYLGVRKANEQNVILFKLKVKLKKKLFYSSFLRYMIVSNMKLNYTAWAFLLSSFSFATIATGLKSCVFILILVGLIYWPLYVAYFLIKNQSKLDEPEMRAKFDTLYQGICTTSLSALMYNSVFSVRRFDIVLLNVIFSPGSPVFNIEHNHFLLKNFGFLFIQTIYVMYVWNTKPHTRNIFNKLEFVNEGVIVLMCYMMICFSGIGPNEYILNSKVALFISIGMTVFVVAANFFVMFRLSYETVSMKCKKLIQARKTKKKEGEENEVPSTPAKIPLTMVIEDDAELESFSHDEEEKEMQQELPQKRSFKLKSLSNQNSAAMNVHDLHQQWLADEKKQYAEQNAHWAGFVDKIFEFDELDDAESYVSDVDIESNEQVIKIEKARQNLYTTNALTNITDNSTRNLLALNPQPQSQQYSVHQQMADKEWNKILTELSIDHQGSGLNEEEDKIYQHIMNSLR